MMVDNEQIKQTPEVLSAAPVTISFKQVLVQNVPPIIVAQPADSSLIDQGMHFLNSVKQTVSGLYSSTVSAIGSAIGSL
jgi:hypothetical protein